jgi:hypothetical protein
MMSKSNVILVAAAVLATVVLLNLAKKDANGIAAKVASIGA